LKFLNATMAGMLCFHVFMENQNTLGLNLEDATHRHVKRFGQRWSGISSLKDLLRWNIWCVLQIRQVSSILCHEQMSFSVSYFSYDKGSCKLSFLKTCDKLFREKEETSFIPHGVLVIKPARCNYVQAENGVKCLFESVFIHWKTSVNQVLN